MNNQQWHWKDTEVYQEYTEQKEGAPSRIPRRSRVRTRMRRRRLTRKRMNATRRPTRIRFALKGMPMSQNKLPSTSSIRVLKAIARVWFIGGLLECSLLFQQE